MEAKRTKRLNSLLKQVLSDVIRKEVRDPRLHPFCSVTHVEISKDLQHAKVYVSVIGSEKEKQQTLQALQSAAGFIAISASKEVVIRYFPQLFFKLDTTVDEHMKIESILGKIHEEEKTRNNPKRKK
ncbi:MAG: 30S ribosome-binding factor RbfA [Chlamydiae bacterium]|nr:30S ribosome-binding factor RbfA [Chlamydiota bacterium]